MTIDDDLREARRRLASAEADMDGRKPAAHSPRRLAGRVIAPVVGATAPVWVNVHPVRLSGPDSPGSVATLDADASQVIPVLVLGTVPAVGDYLVAKAVDGRWAAQRPGKGGGSPYQTITLPSCFCPVPKTLRMTSVDEACNYRMFQSCTLQYGPPPAIFASLNITGPTFLGTTLFLDPISNASFYYHLYCLNNQFLLTRLYPTSPYGSPFRDGTLYTWLTGGGNCVGGVMRTNDCAAGTYRNPCWSTWSRCVSDQYASTHGGVHLAFDGSGNPIGIGGGPADVSGTEYAHCGARPAYQYTAPGFRLHGGQAFPGSDATCSVIIDPA